MDRDVEHPGVTLPPREARNKLFSEDRCRPICCVRVPISSRARIPVGIDHGRAEVVGDFGVSGLVKEPECNTDLGQLGVRGNRVSPERWHRAANLGMLLQDIRRIVLGVKRERNEANLPARSGKAPIRWASSENFLSISGQKSGSGHRV